MAVLAAVAAGCGGSSAVTLTQVAPGQEGCPTGGVLISDGKTAQVVCNGSTQPTATTLPPGDKDCPAGGVQIDSPQADGTVQHQKVCSAPGGIVARSTNLAPGDIHCPAGGVMVEFSSVPTGSTTFDPNNIISTQFLCSPTVTPIGSLVAPGGPAGTATLRTRGGDGASGDGGAGGNVSLTMVAGSLSGHVKIWKTGTATASVAMPAAPTSLDDLGPVPLKVVAGQPVTVTVGTTDDTCAAAGVYTFSVLEGSVTVPRIRSCASAGVPPETVTGISVAKGGVLSFDGAACAAEGAFPATACARATVERACANAGLVTVNKGGIPDPPRLALTCGSFRGEEGSTIAVTPGGFAGVTSAGAIHNGGVIDVSQGSGAIELTADLGLVSTGNLLANGAAGSAGGAGGAIRLRGGVAGVAVSGVLDTSGGRGDAGGAAGPVAIAVSTGGGALRSAASIRAAGGAGRGASACGGTTACDGGAGGAVTLAGLNGDVVVSGTIVTAGGSSAAGTGGAGGAVGIGTTTGPAPQSGGTTIATGSVWISGSIDAGGGNGTAGGAGGAVAVTLDPSTAPAGQEIVLFGFASVDASGGDGTVSGGGGGAVLLANEASFLDGGTAPGGAVLNAADVVASGGQATGVGGLGGQGGTIDLHTQSRNAFPGQASEFAINSGTLTANGGSGAQGGDATNGVAAGATAIRLYGRTGVQNSGTLAASGGGAAAASAGLGGDVVLASDAGPVENAAGIRADGGAATSGATTDNTAQDGGTVRLTGSTVTNSAPISAAGGDAAAGAGQAGNGGAIQMTGSQAPVTNTGALTVRAGTGPLAVPGTVLIDGVLVHP
jgi:hypothetical protein